MLVDNEEDNKTHRPVAPKDVRFSICQLLLPTTSSLLVLVLNVAPVCPFRFYPGSKEASALPRQPGGDHKR